MIFEAIFMATGIGRIELKRPFQSLIFLRQLEITISSLPNSNRPGLKSSD